MIIIKCWICSSSSLHRLNHCLSAALLLLKKMTSLLYKQNSQFNVSLGRSLSQTWLLLIRQIWWPRRDSLKSERWSGRPHMLLLSTTSILEAVFCFGAILLLFSSLCGSRTTVGLLCLIKENKVAGFEFVFELSIALFSSFQIYKWSRQDCRNTEVEVRSLFTIFPA